MSKEVRLSDILLSKVEPGGLLQSSSVGSKSIWLASAVTCMCASCPSSERRRDVMVKESEGCSVNLLKGRDVNWLHLAIQV